MSETKNTTPFSQHLAYINKGTLDAELTEALAEVIKAVRETGKKGAVTLTLNCQMLNTRDENTMKVTPKVSRTIPELDRADTIMFSTSDGDLLRDDPSQTQLDLKVIEPTAQTAPIKLAQ
ncbi:MULTISPECIES: hypothetical protein [Citrobacter]|uniref:Uncharacterized protein n=1 Tax=Citrobacter koseri TaxID=545 RepID=A0AAW4EMA9_CITKO|nr:MULTISPECIES: hypothetical protein [Citrobacter]OFV13584.1 hypothetical protein HMPREF3126_10760 [Salmonella sp. HMSC13B08]ELO4689975.1 hypothetical protein [Citrobacter koseri]MBI0676025.1 hypothetical protein [Citrobacter koseri]MBJ8714992.1 hypothetical protein [Citrobacter koseri]MBJ8752549.1 hypothetical protein [Citrobacter koseri]